MQIEFIHDHLFRCRHIYTEVQNHIQEKENNKQEKPLRVFTPSISHSPAGDECPLLCDTFLATADVESGFDRIWALEMDLVKEKRASQKKK